MVTIVKKKVKGKNYWYAVESARVDGKPRIVWQLYLGPAERIIEVFQKQREISLKSFEFGNLAALLSIAEELNFSRIVEQATGSSEAWKYFLLIIAGRFSQALSKKGTLEWYGETFLPMLWRKMRPYEQELLRKMDLLTDSVVEAISLELAKQLLEKGLAPKLLILDPTNFFTYIEEGGEELPRKGKSKEKRNDKNLINLALAVSQDNLPFYHEVYPGNEQDAKRFPMLLEGIVKRLAALNIDSEELALVFDRGNNSEDNIDLVLEHMHVIGSAKRNQVPELFEVALEKYEELYTTNKENKVLGYRTKAVLFNREFTIVVTFNAASCERQEESYRENKAKILKQLKEIKKKLERKGKGKKLTLEGALKRAFKLIPPQYESVFKVEIQEGNFSYRVDEEKERELYLSFGKQVIFTDLHDWSSTDIVKGYFSKYILDEDFKAMKGALIIPVKPIFHWKDRRIKAHIFLCFLGMLFFRYLMLKVKSTGLSEVEVIEELEKIRLAIVKEKNSKKPKVMLEQMNLQQAGLFSILSLNRYMP